MQLTNIMIILFLLSAFTIGIALNDNGGDLIQVNNAIDNASNVINEINLTYIESNSSIPNGKGIYLILEKYIQFIGTFAFEIMRAGITFGHDNPDYFEPEFIILIMKLIIVAMIISLLIKPTIYIIIFLVMMGIYILDYIKKHKKIRKRTKDRMKGG